jgi:uncharacterized protein
VSARLKLSHYRATSEPFVDPSTGNDVRVVLGTRTGETCVIDTASWNELAAGRLDGLAPGILVDLIDMELVVPEHEDERAVVLGRTRAAVDDNDDLYVVIQPTQACQLGCGYCGQEHTAARLGEGDQDLLVERVARSLRSQRFRTLSIGWFGAEPLLAMPVIRRLSNHLQSLASQYGVSYSASVTTNGLALTDEVATELVRECAVTSIEVTLDGLEADHDRRRHWKNGAPSFDRILANLLNVARRDDLEVRLSVRCNTVRANAEGVVPLIDLLADLGLQRRVSFYAAAVHSWGNDAHLRSLDDDEFAKRQIEWMDHQQRRGFAVDFVPGLRPVVCMSVVPSAEVVEANGEIVSCTEVSYVPAYGSPNVLRVGHLHDRDVSRIRGRVHLRVSEEPSAAVGALRHFPDRIAQGTLPCSNCEMLPVCGGGCPKEWMEGRAPCPPSKYNIGSRLQRHYMSTLTATGASLVPS